jgi:phosphoadenosine phosphosulfate reductase
MNKNQLWQIPSSLCLNQDKFETLHTRLQTIANSVITNKDKCIKFASSLAAEDMIITHAILTQKLDIKIFVLNTGRLHQQTLDLIDEIEQVYAYKLEVFTPNQQDVEEYVSNKGQNAFYESLDLRKECCYIRKVEPLSRALSNANAWITGQRQAQSTTRNDLEFAQLDNSHNGIVKYNPIFDWNDDDVWAYIKHYNVLLNKLHFQGYPSIGCEPCTRPIRLNENLRAGRWWWEDAQNKECGLHK